MPLLRNKGKGAKPLKMSKSYKKRLHFHRMGILKKLIPVSILPLLIVVLLVTVQILSQAPGKWSVDTIVLSTVDATTVYEAHSGSDTVALITDAKGRSFVVSQMKPTEASRVLKAGTSYTATYASEFGRLHIRGLCKENGDTIIDINKSIKVYESNRTASTVICLLCLGIMVVLFIIVFIFFCKEERKQIKHLKKKIKQLSLSSPIN